MTSSRRSLTPSVYRYGFVFILSDVKYTGKVSKTMPEAPQISNLVARDAVWLTGPISVLEIGEVPPLAVKLLARRTLGTKEGRGIYSWLRSRYKMRLKTRLRVYCNVLRYCYFGQEETIQDQEARK